MGNAGSNHPRDWNKDPTKSIDGAPSSPSKDGEAFIFDKKTDDDNSRNRDYDSIEDGAPYYTKPVPESDVEFTITRPRSNTLTEEETKISDDLKILPTVFKWEGGGKQVQYNLPNIYFKVRCFYYVK